MRSPQLAKREGCSTNVHIQVWILRQMLKSACEVFGFFYDCCLEITKSFGAQFGMKQKQWTEVGVWLARTPRFPSQMGDKMPRAKEGREPLGLAMLGCHTVGSYLSDKAMEQARQSRYREVVSSPCELETYYFTAWSSLDQRWIKMQANPKCLVCQHPGMESSHKAVGM